MATSSSISCWFHIYWRSFEPTRTLGRHQLSQQSRVQKIDLDWSRHHRWWDGHKKSAIDYSSSFWGIYRYEMHLLGFRHICYWYPQWALLFFILVTSAFRLSLLSLKVKITPLTLHLNYYLQLGKLGCEIFLKYKIAEDLVQSTCQTNNLGNNFLLQSLKLLIHVIFQLLLTFLESFLLFERSQLIKKVSNPWAP